MEDATTNILIMVTTTGTSAIWPRRPCRGVAQPGSAPEWGSGGRQFKSAHPDHTNEV